MKILLRLPTWLGDAVMATPTYYALKREFPKAHFTLIGSKASLGIFQREKATLILDESKKSKNRLFYLYKLGRNLGKFDIAITLQNNFPSAWLLWATKSKIRIGYQANIRSFLLTHPLPAQKHLHQVLQYTHLLSALSLNVEHPHLQLIAHPQKRGKLIRIGISAGAKYGSAKRWCEAYFIEVIATLLQEGYEVLLYGGEEEIQSNQRIQNALIHLVSIQNFHNLTAKTSITELIDSIASLDLFLTNDSGPMHIASALCIPLIALFGPTDCTETSPFNTQSAQIIFNKHLSCSPCKKRECPLKHHQCMKLITPDEVLSGIKNLLHEIKA
ncbi:lipopolysaccharide heptosyltransferase II [Helicobacter cholecystus]|nr:lipopolysaccharide heptosyltransferase II [Helicobacter cholecystus]